MLSKLCIDQTGQTFVNEEVKYAVIGFVNYAIRGFANPKLTLGTSAFCFYTLCQDNRVVLAESAEQLAMEIMQLDFVATWSYQQCYQDILHAFGTLIT